MSKHLAMFGVVVVLCIAGFVFVSGCDKEATAANEENQSVGQKETQATCPKALDSSEKGTCGFKTDQACPSDCKMECCAAKQKAGTCPVESNKSSCSKNSDAL